MLCITYDKRNHKITAAGHANSAEKGSDLVCAAASILIYTVAANALAMRDNGYARFVSTKLEEGDSEIVCTPMCRYASVIDLVLSTACVGFELLEKRYPENVSFRVVG